MCLVANRPIRKTVTFSKNAPQTILIEIPKGNDFINWTEVCGHPRRRKPKPRYPAARIKRDERKAYAIARQLRRYVEDIGAADAARYAESIASAPAMPVRWIVDSLSLIHI